MIKSILFIDDDPDDLDFFRESVSKINPYHECLTSLNGQEALEQLREEKIKPHFIFLDLNMPRFSGQEFLRQIKQISTLAYIPVIILSTSRLSKELLEVYLMGAHSFIQKPNSTHELTESIKKIIET